MNKKIMAREQHLLLSVFQSLPQSFDGLVAQDLSSSSPPGLFDVSVPLILVVF